VFDLNGLKEINDTRGHQVGDQFIKDGCQYICRTFQHSPVFRVGGDEFVVISQGDDYKNIDSLMAGFIKANFERKEKGEVVIAAGMSRYNGDRSVAEVFRRADTEMYENKKSLKM
jgi:diguanylate cyclase (GGDEF)-like protein